MTGKKSSIMRFVIQTIVFYLFTMAAIVSAASNISGTVSAMGNGEVVVEIVKGTAKNVVPATGDKVEFTLEIPGLDIPAEAGKGEVIRVEDKMVTIRVTEGTPSFEAKATIQATGKPAALTPARRAKLGTIFSGEHLVQELKDAACLEERWCLSGEKDPQSGACEANILVCGKRAATGKPVGFSMVNMEEYMTKLCNELWNSLTPQDWSLLEPGKPCSTPLPKVLRIPVFSKQEASCIAKFECQEEEGEDYKECVDDILGCTQNQSTLKPLDREACRKKRDNADPRDEPIEEPVQECLRPAGSQKKASLEPEIEKQKLQTRSACKQAIGFWLPEKKDKNVDYIELALSESTGLSETDSVNRILRAVGTEPRTGSWECRDSTKGKVVLEIGDSNPYPATMTIDSKTQRAHLCIDGENICFLRSTRPAGK